MSASDATHSAAHVAIAAVRAGPRRCRHRWPHVPGAALTVALVFASTEAAAQADAAPLDRAVTIEGDDPCYARELVLAQLQRWLERSRFDGSAQVVIEAPLAQPTAFRVMRGSRVVARRRFGLSRAPCAEQRAATTLAIAIALDPAVLQWITLVEPTDAAPSQRAPAAVAPDRAGATAATAPTPTAPAIAPSAAAPEALSARSGWSARASLDALFAWATLPSPAGGVALSLSVSPASIVSMFVRAGSLVALPAALGEGQVRSTLAFAQAGSCVHSSSRFRIGVEGCASVLGGLVFARGDGFARSMDASSSWGAAAVALGGRWSFHPRLALIARGEWVVPWVALRFDVLDASGQVAASVRPSVMGASFALGLAVTIF